MTLSPNDYPVSFVNDTERLDDYLGPRAGEALDILRMPADDDMTYDVRAGLTKYHAGSIAIMAAQPHINTFCPEDLSRRFTTPQATQDWMSQGRAMFVLTKQYGQRNTEQRLIGYGWTGRGTAEEVVGGESKFAVRIGEEALKTGKAAPLSHLIIAASARMFGARNFWLKTRESNQAAVGIYQTLGFEEVDYQPLASRKNRPKMGTPVVDRQIYMRLPNTILDQLS